MEIKINGKALLGIAMLSAGLAFGNFVSIIDAKSAGGIIVEEEQTPVGTVAMWTNNTPPDGWIEMNGQSTASYPELAKVVGANVPDLRGEFVRGWDNGKGIDSGRGIKSLQLDALQNHRHYLKDGQVDTFNGSDEGNSAHTNNTEYSVDHSGQLLKHEIGSISTSLDARFDDETRPRNIALMYIIKAK